MKNQRINLLPKAYKRQQTRKKYQLLIAMAVVVEGIIFVFQVVCPSKAALKRSSEALEKVGQSWEEESLSEINQSIRVLEEQQTELERWQQQYSQIKQEHWINKGLLDSLTSRVPEELSINKMTFPIEKAEEINRSIEIEGNSKTMVALLNYITILEGIFGGNGVCFECEYSEKVKSYEYDIQIQLSSVLRTEKADWRETAEVKEEQSE